MEKIDIESLSDSEVLVLYDDVVAETDYIGALCYWDALCKDGRKPGGYAFISACRYQNDCNSVGFSHANNACSAYGGFHFAYWICDR